MVAAASGRMRGFVRTRLLTGLSLQARARLMQPLVLVLLLASALSSGKGRAWEGRRAAGKGRFRGVADGGGVQCGHGLGESEEGACGVACCAVRGPEEQQLGGEPRGASCVDGRGGRREVAAGSGACAGVGGVGRRDSLEGPALGDGCGVR